MNAGTTDRNLLVGILALQMDFINRDRLIAAMNAWILDKSQGLEQILVEQNAIDANTRELIAALVEKHLQLHQGDPQRSLAAVSSIDPSIQHELKQLEDSGVEASLRCVRTLDRSPPDPGAASSIDSSLMAATHDMPSRIGEGSRFQPVRPHARGGLGQVSVAIDQELNREVALKEIQEQHADNPEYRSRFVAEAEVTGGLEHPGIVPVYGLGTYSNGRPFYAMRFVKGDSLRTANQRFHEQSASHGKAAYHGLEFRRLLSRFVDVCNAIQYAHSRGVLHRDLKPGNIMLGKFGETLVVDWGLAKVVGRPEQQAPSDEPTLNISSGSGSAPTQMGSAIGTPAYMSPEQARGDLESLGPRSDVYSLGATLYALLTGKRPFSDNDVGQVLRKVQAGEFPAPREVKRFVPPALQAICLKAMATRPEDRYESPQHLADEVEHWLADESVAAYPEPILARSARFIRRNLAATISAAVAVGLVLLIVSAYVIDRQVRSNAVATGAERLVAEADLQSERGKLDSASLLLAEADGLCEAESGPAIQKLREQITAKSNRVKALIEFRQRADEVLARGVHGMGASRTDEPDPLTQQATNALAHLEIEGNPQWLQCFEEVPLPEESIEQFKQAAHDLLLLKALRLALYDTQDEACQRRTEQALGLLRQAERLKAPSCGVWMCRMRFNRRLEEDPEADAASDRMVETQSVPFTAVDYYLFGSVAMAILKDPDAAETHYNLALSVQPNHYGAAFGLSTVYEERGDVRAKIAALDRVLAIAPDDEVALLSRGFEYFRTGKYNESLEDFQRCTSLAPQNQAAQYFLGRCWVIAQEWEKADNRFTKAIELAPADTRYHAWRAIARAHLPNRYRGALEDIELTLSSGEVDGDDHWRAGRVYALAAGHLLNPEQAEGQPAENPDAAEQAEGDRYAATAVEHVAKALAAGAIERRNLASTDLDTLRDRDDFQALQSD